MVCWFHKKNIALLKKFFISLDGDTKIFEDSVSSLSTP